MRSQQTWTTVGHVTRPAVQTVPTFAAAAYVPAGAVAATAVHGIRIRTPSSASEPAGLSIQPRDFQTLPEGYGGHIPGKSAIITDIGAGEAIFRQFAPLVGDPVKVETSQGLQNIAMDWQPLPGDVLVIISSEPVRPIRDVEFENREGGAVVSVDAEGVRRKIGVVRQPVRGIGRFDGTSYTGIGAVNTNHGGVITISTAPESRPLDEGRLPERRGGFEIQPYQHSRSQPTMPQAMIVAPLDTANTFEGEGPLFYGMLTLGDGSEVVDMKTGEGPWRAFPAMTGKVDDALTAAGISRFTGNPASEGGVTAIRIRREPRDYDKLAERLKMIAKADTGASPEILAESGVEWTLKMPYPAGAEYAVFSAEGKTLAVTNIAPFRISLSPGSIPHVIRAEIISSDGRTLEARSGRLRATGRKLDFVESRAPASDRPASS